MDFSSAENLLASLRGVSIDGCSLKQDLAIPELFANPRWSENIIHDRSDLFRQIFQGFAQRVHGVGKRSQATKDNPLIALQSAPGGSKSLSLDLLARLDDSVLGEIQHSGLSPEQADVLLDTLKASLPICVTYNAASTLQRDEITTCGADLSLAMRMLFSCLFTGSFSLFYDEFISSMHLSHLGQKKICSVCIGALYLAAKEAGKSSILLLVDELLKSGPKDNGHVRVFETCSVIGSFLNEMPVSKFNAVLSSLSQTPLFNVTKESGRPIHWVYMRRPSVDDSLRLFAHFEGKVSAEEFRCIQWCCVDCGGHYQSLRCLAEAIEKAIGAKTPISYAPLRIEMVGRFQARDIGRDLVDAGLCSRPLLLTTILSNGKSVTQSIADGDLLNVLEDPASSGLASGNAVVPLLSPAVLWKWSVVEQVRLDAMIFFKANELPHSSADRSSEIDDQIARLEAAKNLPAILLELLKRDDAPGGVYWYVPEVPRLLGSAPPRVKHGVEIPGKAVPALSRFARVQQRSLGGFEKEKAISQKGQEFS